MSSWRRDHCPRCKAKLLIGEEHDKNECLKRFRSEAERRKQEILEKRRNAERLAEKFANKKPKS